MGCRPARISIFSSKKFDVLQIDAPWAEDCTIYLGLLLRAEKGAVADADIVYHLGRAISDRTEIRYAHRIIRNLRGLGLGEADSRAAGQIVIVFGIVSGCGGDGQQQGQGYGR